MKLPPSNSRRGARGEVYHIRLARGNIDIPLGNFHRRFLNISSVRCIRYPGESHRPQVLVRKEKRYNEVRVHTLSIELGRLPVRLLPSWNGCPEGWVSINKRDEYEEKKRHPV